MRTSYWLKSRELLSLLFFVSLEIQKRITRQSLDQRVLNLLDIYGFYVQKNRIQELRPLHLFMRTFPRQTFSLDLDLFYNSTKWGIFHSTKLRSYFVGVQFFYEDKSVEFYYTVNIYKIPGSAPFDSKLCRKKFFVDELKNDKNSGCKIPCYFNYFQQALECCWPSYSHDLQDFVLRIL